MQKNTFPIYQKENEFLKDSRKVTNAGFATCLRCSIKFNKVKTWQVFCGSKRQRIGCSWQNQLDRVKIWFKNNESYPSEYHKKYDPTYREKNREKIREYFRNWKKGRPKNSLITS